jgi:type IV pilus assembly protein PilM
MLIDSVKSMMEESALTAKDVNISVSGQSTIVRFVSMPKMSSEELKGAIRFEAEKHIPFPIEECILDYQVLKKDDKDNKIEVLLAAAKKAFIMEKVAAIEGCGLAVNLIDVDSFAVANCFLKNFPEHDASKSAALLDIGAGITNVSIVQGQAMRFSRDIAIGGADLTSAVSKSLNLDMKTSEGIKLAPGPRLQEVINCTKNTLSTLFDELRLSFSYYENQSGSQVDEVYISGGAAISAGLDSSFSEAFETKPVMWDSLQFLDKSKLQQNADLANGMGRCFAVAAGLAVR